MVRAPCDPLHAFDLDGTMRTEISGLSRLLSHASIAVAKSLRDAGHKAVDDHGISYYVTHCERLARAG